MTPFYPLETSYAVPPVTSTHHSLATNYIAQCSLRQIVRSFLATFLDTPTLTKSVHWLECRDLDCAFHPTFNSEIPNDSPGLRCLPLPSTSPTRHYCGRILSPRHDSPLAKLIYHASLCMTRSQPGRWIGSTACPVNFDISCLPPKYLGNPNYPLSNFANMGTNNTPSYFLLDTYIRIPFEIL